MTQNKPPLLLEPEQLLAVMHEPELVIVDLSRASTHAQVHLPGARLLDYNDLVEDRNPVYGLLPQSTTLEQKLSSLGIDNQSHVVAYDDEGGGKAARLLWTLACLGHDRCSLLDGGLHAWYQEKLPLTSESTVVCPSEFRACVNPEPVASREHIIARLDDRDLVLLDARSEDEFSGLKRFARRGGHIPGAVNLEWTLGMNPSNGMRMRTEDELTRLLEQRQITPDKEVICYCQTHHRSSYSYIMLKRMGFPRVKGYPGSWSDWGNRADTPVETD